MCGIAGIYSESPSHSSDSRKEAMLQSMVHRGPDGEGSWISDNGQIHLLHRRLSILDLTESGSQPLLYMHYALIFNGEIYNYKELKETLSTFGYRFFSSGDTEVIAAAYDHYGIDFLHRLDGMFAFALFDTRQKKLIIARDRFGEKPLYFFAAYRERGKLDQLVFGSEIKTLHAYGIPKQLNHSMMVNYLSLGYVQNPIVKTDTFYKNISSLPPGYLLELDVTGQKFSMRRWYEPHKRIGHLTEAETKDEEAVFEQIREKLIVSVQNRLRSDVPVGTSLSGGLDSSTVVALIDRIKKNNISSGGWSNVCFSAVFPGFEKDESLWSRQVAEKFGIHQYLVSPNGQDLAEGLGNMMFYQDEPVQSGSAFTQYMVYKKAQEEAVSVILDGQGADEVFGGYARYSHWYLQQLLRGGFGAMQAEKKALQNNDMLEQWGLLNYAAAWLPWQTAKALQRKAIRQQTDSPVTQEYREAYADHNTLFKPEIRNLEDILFFNTFNFGLEELLRYADRNSMAHSREVRLPFLQHELVEYIFSLPAHFKIREGFGKWVLRKTMETSLPKDIVWRTGKIGFEPPQQDWFNLPPIKDMIQQSRSLMVKEGIVQKKILQEPVGTLGAHDAQNFDWRILSAAFLFSK